MQISSQVPDFKPHLTPSEMLERGVFGGSYFRMACEDDMAGLGDATELAWQNRNILADKKRNYYEVKAGEDYASWLRNGWIFPEDPLGWFHWYCRWEEKLTELKFRIIDRYIPDRPCGTWPAALGRFTENGVLYDYTLRMQIKRYSRELKIIQKRVK